MVLLLTLLAEAKTSSNGKTEPCRVTPTDESEALAVCLFMLPIDLARFAGMYRLFPQPVLLSPGRLEEEGLSFNWKSSSLGGSVHCPAVPLLI
jgi:hypothetical protein